MFRLAVFAILTVAAIAQTTPAANQKKYAISGTVVDSVRGGALRDIAVSIRTAQSDVPLRSAVTGDDGRFEFRDLPRGKYGLSAQGHGFLGQAYQEHGNYSTAIVTGEGLQSEGLVFPLKPESSISGVITDEYNEPVPRVQVMLFVTGVPGTEEAIFPRGETSTDDVGRYRFSHLPEGKYYIAVQGRPWYAKDESQQLTEGGSAVVFEDNSATSDVAPAPTGEEVLPRGGFDVAYPTTYYPNVSDAEQASPIILNPGDRVAADFHLFAVPALRLRFRGTAGGAHRVSVLNLEQRIFGSVRQASGAVLRADGTAEFTGLAPGQYVLRLPSDESSAAREMTVDLTADMEIAPGKSSEPLSMVSGTVQVEGGSASPQGHLGLSNFRQAEAFGAPVSDKGEFKIENGVRPGQYNVMVANRSGYFVKSVSAVGARVTGRQVEIRRGASVRLTIVLTKGLARVDGVALRDGQPASQTAIFLVPDDPGHNLPLFRRDQSDSDGTFTLRQVVPGNYTLVSIAEGWRLEWTDPAVLKPYLEHGVKVRVEGDRKYQLKVDVQRGEQSATAQ